MKRVSISPPAPISIPPPSSPNTRALYPASPDPSASMEFSPSTRRFPSQSLALDQLHTAPPATSGHKRMRQQERAEDALEGPSFGVTRLNPLNPFGSTSALSAIGASDDILLRASVNAYDSEAQAGTPQETLSGVVVMTSGLVSSPSAAVEAEAPGHRASSTRATLAAESLASALTNLKLHADTARVLESALRRRSNEKTQVVEGLKRLSRSAKVAVAGRGSLSSASSSKMALPSVLTDISSPRYSLTRSDTEEVGEEGEAQDARAALSPKGVKPRDLPGKSGLAPVVSPRQTTDSRSSGGKGLQARAGSKRRLGQGRGASGAASPHGSDGETASERLQRATHKLTAKVRMLEMIVGKRQGGGAVRVQNRRSDMDVLRSSDFLKSLRSGRYEMKHQGVHDSQGEAQVATVAVSTPSSSHRRGQNRQRHDSDAALEDVSATGRRASKPRQQQRRQQPLLGLQSPKPRSAVPSLALSPAVVLDLPQHIVPHQKDPRLHDTLRIITDPSHSVRWPSKKWEEFATASRRLADWRALQADDQPVTPRHAYLQACDSMGIRAEAAVLKLIKAAERDGFVRLQSYRLGDQHARALSEVMGTLDLQAVNLSDNRLTHRGLSAVLPTLQSDALQKLNLSHNILGPQGLELLARFVEASTTLVWLSVENTCLDDAAAARLFVSLRRARVERLTGELVGHPIIRHLNASRNFLSDHSMAALAALLSDPCNNTNNLDVSWNKVRPSGGVTLSAALAGCSLDSLDLSWNSLGSMTGQAGEALGQALASNQRLTHLDLGFNNLTPADCQPLSSALQQNHTLLGLHMSGNSGGLDGCGFVTGADQPCGDSRYVAHIFTRILSSVFQKVRGREIWSFRSRCWLCEHWKEVRFVFDPQKYFYYANKHKQQAAERDAPPLVPPPPQQAQRPSRSLSSPIIIVPSRPPSGGRGGGGDDDSSSSDSTSSSDSSSDSSDDEEGGASSSSVARPKRPKGTEAVAFGNDDVDQVLFHASFDDWRPEPMQRMHDGTFVLYRMAPPGLSYYYFHVDGGLVAIRRSAVTGLHAHEHPVTQLSASSRAEVGAGPQVPAELHVCSVRSDVDAPSSGLGTTTVKLAHCQPRQRSDDVFSEDYWGADRRRRRSGPRNLGSGWSIEQSFFQGFRRDSDELMGRAFLADYAHTRLDAKLTKKWPDDLEAAKAALRRHYALLKNVFKHYAAAYSSEVFNMGQGAYNEFLNRCAILDPEGKGCDRVEADTLFITVNISGPKHPFNPKRALTRAQFMEIVTGLAIAKFVKTGLCDTPSQAIDRLVEENIRPRAERDDPNTFRREYLHFKEGPETVFKDYELKLRKLFDHFTGAENLPGEQHSMSLSEWCSLVEAAGVIDDFLVDRNVRLAYIRSKMTEVDELNDRKSHRRMVFCEFLEAIMRIAVISWRAEAAYTGLKPVSDSADDFPLSALREMIQRLLWVLDPHHVNDDVQVARRASIEASRRASLSTSRRGSESLLDLQQLQRPSVSDPTLLALGQAMARLATDGSAGPI